MPMQITANSRVTINGVAYAIQRIRRGGRVQANDVDNTEGQPGNPDAATALGFGAVLPDLRKGDIELTQAAFDDDNNPHEGPIALVEGEYYNIQHYPAGLAGPAADYGNVLCVECVQEGSSPGPLIPRAVFRTDGAYGHPGES
jgi:hypothetical protein